MIRAIIFDCFGVLTSDRWREFIGQLPSGANKEKAREVHRAYCAGLLSKEETTKQITEATGKVFTELEDNFSEGPVKNVALLDYIKSLKPSYKIGLLSNVASNWIKDYFLTAEEQDLFDAFVFSFEVGTTKPDPRIFQIMLDKLEVEPAETVMVDDIERYAQAAKELGMQAIWYRDFSQLSTELNQLLYPS